MSKSGKAAFCLILRCIQRSYNLYCCCNILLHSIFRAYWLVCSEARQAKALPVCALSTLFASHCIGLRTAHVTITRQRPGARAANAHHVRTKLSNPSRLRTGTLHGSRGSSPISVVQSLPSLDRWSIFKHKPPEQPFPKIKNVSF